jgi:hypothetical protein
MRVMLKLSNIAFAMAFTQAFVYVLLVAVTTGRVSLAQHFCKIGVSLCDHPSLLLITSAVTFAWALMLRMIRN